MAKCEVCGRPATAQVTINENGELRRVSLCSEHYAEIVGSRSSPLESLFRDPMFERFMGNSGFGSAFQGANRGTGEDVEPPARRPGARSTARRGGEGQSSREAVDLQSFLSESAAELLQQAAEKAVEYGKKDVDTEHLLLALTENPVVEEILREFKLSPEDLRKTIEENAPRGTRKVEGEKQVHVGVSPRAKSALENALVASRELEHSYVGPEHILIGLVEEDDGFAGEMLRKLGLTPQALRQKTVKVVGKGEGFPVATNDDSGGRQQNRRVEIVFSDRDGQFASGANASLR